MALSGTPLRPYLPVGSNQTRPSMTERGEMPGGALTAVSDITPMENPFWLKLKNEPCTAAYTQEQLVDRYRTSETLMTPVSLSDAPAAFATAAGQQVSATTTTSTINNRSKVSNEITTFEKTFAISKGLEKLANMGGISGGITSELERTLKRLGREMMVEVEKNCLSNRTKVADLEDCSTIGAAAGMFKLINTLPLEWADHGLTLNLNVGLDQNGIKVPLTVASINDIGEKEIQDAGEICFLEGGNDLLDVYCPAFWVLTCARHFKGRPNTAVNVKQDEVLSMSFDTYEVNNQCLMKLIPHRNMTKYGIFFCDHKQASKRIFFPFEVRRATQDGTRRNREGVMDMTWTILPGNPLAHVGLAVTASLPT